ncbi:MAG: hypothetical protein C0623_02625 [Desulfuromonas sp.]|nr:MAG: hypothetical protein C0623_02625 [Desulfuromonas sp.]
MSISDRYRSLSEEVRIFASIQKKRIGEDAEASLKAAARSLKKADKILDELKESVGEIPRISLEFKLTPILLKAHNTLDRSRLDFIDAGDEKTASEVWMLQQTIYRLLNDL